MRALRWLATATVLLCGCTVHLTAGDVFTFQSPAEPAPAPPPGWTAAAEPAVVGEARWARGPASRGTVLYFPGSGYGSRVAEELLLPRLAPLGLDLLTLDYRPRGALPPRVLGVRKAAEALLARALATGKPVYVGGHSLGAWFALDLARHREVAGVFLLGAGTTVAEVSGSVTHTPATRFVPDADLATLDAEALARAAVAPVLVVGSDADTVMPEAFQRRLLAALPGPGKGLTLLHGVDHSGYLQSDATWKALAAFLQPVSTPGR